MNFSDKLHSLLTARGGVIKYAELFSIIETLLNDAYKKNEGAFISSGLIVTRWLSEGFLEVDTGKGGFRLRRPSLYSCGSGQWAYVGARYTPAIDYLKTNLIQLKAVADEYASPKLIFTQKPDQPLNLASITKCGCDVYGNADVTAAQVIAAAAGSLASRTEGQTRACDQAALALRWFKIEPNNFSLSEVEVSKAKPGHYILRNHGSGVRPIWRYIKLLPNQQIIAFEDWRWLYTSMLSEAAKMSEFFYEPRKHLFCVIRITGPYTRQENWIPRELAEALGAASAAKSISTATIQDVDGINKSIVIYPNVSRSLALSMHEALGMNNTHPLRYLQY